MGTLEKVSREMKLPASWPSAMFTSEHVADLFYQATRCSQQRNLLQSHLSVWIFCSASQASRLCRNADFFLSSLSCPLDFSARVYINKKRVESMSRSARCQQSALNCMCSRSQMSSGAPWTSPAAYWEARLIATVGGRARLITRVSCTLL